jgi:HK97 family phage major capsid protein
MTHALSDIQVPKTLAGAVLKGLEKGSVFQSFASQVPLDGAGRLINVLGQADAVWYGGETQLRPVVDADVSQIELVSKGLGRTTLYTKELQNDIPALTKAIEEEIANSLSRTIDKTVAGLVTAPAGFSTLAGVDTVVVTDYQSYRAAIATKNGYATDGIALNVFALDAFHGLMTPSGVPALNIVGDYNSGTINGIAYKVFNGGTEPLAFVGPFKERVIWGVVDGSTTVQVLTETAKTSDGVVHALKQEGLIGVTVDTRVGMLVIDPSDFTKIGFAPSGS